MAALAAASADGATLRRRARHSLPNYLRTPMTLNEAMDNLASRLPPERLLFVSWSTAVHDDDATACEVTE